MADNVRTPRDSPIVAIHSILQNVLHETRQQDISGPIRHELAIALDVATGALENPASPRESPAAPRFVNVKNVVMQGSTWVATCCSKTFAKRIANALNNHKVNSEGV